MIVARILRRPNEHALFLENLRAVVAGCSDEKKNLALLVVQVEHLDKVEGAFGYDVSHALLDEFHSRMQTLLREKDRLIQVSDRKFWLMLNELMNEGHSLLAANQIRHLVNQPFEIRGHSVKLDASVGIAMYPAHAENPEDLARRSELALASAREAGLPFQLYSMDSTIEMSSLWRVEAELDRALDESELEPYFQPKIDLRTGAPCGAEALLRWNHPSRGILTPDKFISVAEKANKLVPITWFVLNAALRQRSEWSDKWEDLPVSVNLSTSVLESELLIHTVEDALKIWGGKPAHLILEITEESLAKNPEKSLAIMEQLTLAGVQISIDDFGTGYSSMAYLKDMPANELKIDKSFVMNMLNDDGDERIVRMTIDLAHAFGFKVVAEGVESRAVQNALIELKCDTAQGFLYAKPLPLRDFVKWLDRYDPSDFFRPGSAAGQAAAVAAKTGASTVSLAGSDS